MYKILFIASHLCSGSYGVQEILNRNHRVQIVSTTRQYARITDIQDLVKMDHKCRNTAAIYGDQLLYNPTFCNKNLFKLAKFIYVIRPAKQTIHEIMTTDLFLLEEAVRYYTFRLQRLASMAKRTPGAVFLTWDNLAAGKGLDLIREYLYIKEEIEFDPECFPDYGLDSIPAFYINEAEKAYERYLYLMKQLDLRTVQ